MEPPNQPEITNQPQPPRSLADEQMATDPVCGTRVNKATAQFTATYEAQNQPWQTFYFDSDECKQLFEREPEKYADLPV